MKKTNRKNTEVSYWESMADSMVALLLCILLIMLLLMLYLVRIDDNDMLDDQLGYGYEDYQDPDDGGGNHRNGQIDDEDGDTFDWNDSVGGGGGGGGGGEEDENYLYEDPDPGIGEGEGSDWAAVLVQVIDGETERTIKKEGITFELYRHDAMLQTLSTYYPKKISYKQYKTDANGVFFLPERIHLGRYYLHCLTAVPGYDTGENTYFEIDKDYDWPDPFVVNVKLYPSKNAIEVHLKDASDGKALTGASFQVIAAENVTTADGTLRYREGSVVDNITVGADGVGISKDLYLGSYLLRQKAVPEYYGKMEKDVAVTLKSRTAAKKTEIVDTYELKTALEVQVVDALYDTTVLPGTKFTLRSDAGVILSHYQADEQGRFTIGNLRKNTSYRIRQETVQPGYQSLQEDLIFRVNADGYIGGTVRAQQRIKNRTLRISVGVQDKLFRNLVSDVNLALMDSEGAVVRNWTSTGMEQVIQGLSFGEYRLIVGGKEESAVTILVEDVTEMQEFRLQRWTTTDIAVIIALCSVAIGLVILLGWLLKKRIKRKKEGR